MLDFLSSLAAPFKAAAAYFGWAAKRSDLNNSPEMQANAAAKTDAVIDNKIADADATAAKGNLEDIRKLASE